MLEPSMTASPLMNMVFVATVKQCFDGSNVNRCMLVIATSPDWFQPTACSCLDLQHAGMLNLMVLNMNYFNNIAVVDVDHLFIVTIFFRSSFPVW